MSKAATDYWTSRDLRVLRAIVEIDNEQTSSFIDIKQIQERIGYDETTVQLSLKALSREHTRFFEREERSAAGLVGVGGVTGHARRTVGAWPSAEQLADRLIEKMLSIAEETEDDEKRGRLRETARWFGNFGRDLLVQIVAAAIMQGMR